MSGVISGSRNRKTCYGNLTLAMTHREAVYSAALTIWMRWTGTFEVTSLIDKCESCNTFVQHVFSVFDLRTLSRQQDGRMVADGSRMWRGLFVCVRVCMCVCDSAWASRNPCGPCMIIIATGPHHHTALLAHVFYLRIASCCHCR